MIRVKDASWDEIKRRIAKVAWAVWTKEGTDWALERPAALARLQTQGIIDRRAQLIGDEFAAKFKKVAPWSQSYLNGLLVNLSNLAEKSRTATRETKSATQTALISASIDAPAGRALRRVLPLMDPREIAAIGAEGQAVYSDHPTQMERRLPMGTAAVLRDFLSEQHDYAAEIERRNDLDPAIDFLDPRFNIVTGNPPASRFIVTFRRYGTGTLEATLTAVDRDGWCVATGRERLEVSRAVAAPFKDFPSKPLALSQQANDFRLIFTVVSGRYGGDIGDRDRAYQLARQWMPIFGDAAKTEPMRFIVGDAVERISKELGMNVVADLPDDLLTVMSFPQNGKDVTSRQLIDEITSWGMNTTGSFGDGWLELMPADPTIATVDRLDRSGMGNLARSIDAKKAAMVDDLADYAAGQPGDLCFRSIDQAFAATYSRGAGETGAGLANYYFATVLRFWGSLSPQQRTAIRSGGSIKVSGLSEPARHWLGEFIYGIPRAFATNFVTPFTQPPMSTARRNAKASPYEVLGDGIPTNSLITGEPISEPMLRVHVKDDEDDNDSTPEVLGGWFANEKWPLSGDKSPLLSVAYAYAPMVRISFDFGHGCTAWTQIGDDATSWSKWMKFDELPDGIRKRTEARYAEAATQKAKDDAKAKARAIPPQ